MATIAPFNALGLAGVRTRHEARSGYSNSLKSLEHQSQLRIQPLMRRSHLNPTAQRTACTMLAKYRVDAIAIAEREVAARIAANELERALQMDQVRRAIIFILAE
jgi:hypothetical protein